MADNSAQTSRMSNEFHSSASNNPEHSQNRPKHRNYRRKPKPIGISNVDGQEADNQPSDALYSQPENNNNMRRPNFNQRRNRPNRPPHNQVQQNRPRDLEPETQLPAPQLDQAPQPNQVRQQPRQRPNRPKTESSTAISQSSNTSRQPKPDKTRTEILIDQLRKNKCECMVCYQNIRQEKPIWQCNCCFHIFHLSCIKKWSQSPAAHDNNPADNTWRCPGCQTIFTQMPNRSTCFCTKLMNPEQNQQNNRPPHARGSYYLPHSCGETCGKPLVESIKFWSSTGGGVNLNTECKHKCTQICHPGPCQLCETIVQKRCACGKAGFQVKCSSSKVPVCEEVCDKFLNCKLHKCQIVCHAGECENCDQQVELSCPSHGNKRVVACGSQEHNLANVNDLVSSCGVTCDKLLSCGHHKCQEICHLGTCPPCSFSPSQLSTCPCGKTPLAQIELKTGTSRKLCTDPVPTCTKPCHKILKCNESHQNENNDVHLCQATCHVGPCPHCVQQVEIKCRCGRETKTMQCFERDSMTTEFMCDRKCQKKKSCGKHVCNEICCAMNNSSSIGSDDQQHICMQICNKPLNCGIHKCEELCHRGACRRCLIASFDERICHCGYTIQYPPIRCGTQPPDCPKPCARPHACDHPVAHTCHWDEERCPPCSYLTSRMCMGNHEMRHNIPCHVKDVSCGKPCMKQLQGCGHKCQRICHRNNCQDQEACTQPCVKERPHCAHKCGAKCHGDSTPCPDTICQELVTIKCKCGFKSKTVKCMQKMYESETQLMFENMASEIKEMLQQGKSLDLDCFKSQEACKKKQETLECDEECLLAERNKALAQALQIDPNNPSSQSQTKHAPIYSEFVRNFAREDLNFVINIEKKFESLIAECNKMTNGTKKSLNLPVMKINERRFIHELASYYDIETQSFDPEPNRNVCLYAIKDKSSSPVILLSQFVETGRVNMINPMSRMLNLKEINQQASASPVKSNLKSLDQLKRAPQLMQPEPIKLSSAFHLLASSELAESVTDSKSKPAIDYFDLTE